MKIWLVFPRSARTFGLTTAFATAMGLAMACERTPLVSPQEPAVGARGTARAEVSSAAKSSPQRPTEPRAAQPLAGNPSAAEPLVLTLGPEHSTSIGSPVEGHLRNAVALPLEGAGFVFNPAKNPQARHGTVELVQALVRAGVAVGRTHPGSPLYINDLSMPRGGDIPGHASHRSGRDADVLFFLLGRDGQPIAPKPIPLDEAGNGTDFGDLSDPSDDVHVRLDVARTWAFAQHLVADPDVRLNRIFVAEHIRSLLLEYGRTHGAPKAALERFGDVTCQPGFPHDDHFHIRVFCSPDDIEAGCLDTPPIYPWHRKELQRLGVTPQLAGRRESPRPKLTSQAEAQARAKERHGAFHDDVVEFLERRKAWVSKPHPGRPFCR